MTVENQLVVAPDPGGEGSPAPEAIQTDNGTGADDGAPQTKAVSYETESEARGMGWVPQAEWRGDPKAWRPADEFVTRGKEVLPIVRSQLDRERRKVQDLESKLNELPGSIEAKYADRFKRLEKMNTVALQKQADQIYRQFEEKKRAAVEAADPAAYDRASEAQRQALADLSTDYESPAEVETKPAPQPQQKAPPEVSDWIDRNSTWFNKDPVLTAAASAYHGQLLKDVPGMALDQNFRKVDEFLRQKFPEKFGIEPQTRAHAPQVEGGSGRQAAGTGKARGWNELPPEAVKAGQKFIDQGLYGTDQKKARDEYAKDYWSQE